MNIYVSIGPKFFVKSPSEVIREFQNCDVNHVVKGFEIYFDFGIREQVEFVKEFANLCAKNGFDLQFHNDCIYEVDRQKQYLDFISLISAAYFHKKRMIVVFHSVWGESVEDNVIKTNEYMSILLNHVYMNNLHVVMSLENLDDKTWAIRLDKSEMKEIIYNNEDLFFTYDIGNEIIDYGGITDVDYLLEKRMINVHLHTFDKFEKHLPITPDDPNKLRWLKALTYLKLINYRGAIVLEYDYSVIKGDSFKEKIINLIRSAEFVNLHLEHD